MKPLVAFGFLGLAGVVVYGGVTGRLAPMLAALFYPAALKPAGGGDAFGGLFGAAEQAVLGPAAPLANATVGGVEKATGGSGIVGQVERAVIGAVA